MTITQNGELPRPTEEQLKNMNKAWKEKAGVDRKNPNLTQEERDEAAQMLLERTTNPDFKTDSQIKK